MGKIFLYVKVWRTLKVLNEGIITGHSFSPALPLLSLADQAVLNLNRIQTIRFPRTYYIQKLFSASTWPLYCLHYTHYIYGKIGEGSQQFQREQWEHILQYPILFNIQQIPAILVQATYQMLQGPCKTALDVS